MCNHQQTVLGNILPPSLHPPRRPSPVVQREAASVVKWVAAATVSGLAPMVLIYRENGRDPTSGCIDYIHLSFSHVRLGDEVA